MVNEYSGFKQKKTSFWFGNKCQAKYLDCMQINTCKPIRAIN